MFEDEPCDGAPEDAADAADDDGGPWRDVSAAGGDRDHPGEDAVAQPRHVVCSQDTKEAADKYRGEAARRGGQCGRHHRARGGGAMVPVDTLRGSYVE